MKIAVVSDVLLELQSNGVIKSDKKLDRDDFKQLSKAAKGYVVRKRYLEEKSMGTEYSFVGGLVSEEEFAVQIDKRKRRTVKYDFDKSRIVRLPDGMGILRITPIDADGAILYQRSYTPGLAGSESLYCTPEWLADTDELIYIFISNQIRLYGDDKSELVEMLFVKDDDDAEIPEEIVWEILNYVLGISLKVVGFPVDPTNDGNPSVQMIKSKLAEAQPL